MNTDALTLCPARLNPLFVPRLWGSSHLDPLFPEKKALAEPIGEVWFTGHDCGFVNGPFSGRTLGEAWREMPPSWAGSRVRKGGPFPLLVKFIFPQDKLSVQVHPNDDYARRHEATAGGMGKTEMWYVIAAERGAEVKVGLQSSVTAESFRRAIANGTAEECVKPVPLATGDAIFVPAGTVHTIGPGMVLCEIQEHSDLTYRVYDFNRLTAEGKPRELHIEKAMDVIHFGKQSCGKLEPVILPRGQVEETYFVACRYFAVEKWSFDSRIAAATTGEHFDLLVVLEGSGKLEWAGSSLEYAPAQLWLIPAALGAYQIAPERHTALLRAYVPDIVEDFVKRMKDQSVPEAAWSRLVYP